ncbi:hypothetical protein G6L73_31145 [Agrobacterium rhizogenes]|nr:hypothetical protein [Rhizobium rhizogenes]NTH35948.1 hypothetical protein [Rhizobium rhizogenes]
MAFLPLHTPLEENQVNFEDPILQHTSRIFSDDETNAFDAMVPPIVQTPLFMFSSHEEMAPTYRGEISRPVYTRGPSPKVRALEDTLAKAEGAEDALGFASGMATTRAASPP